MVIPLVAQAFLPCPSGCHTALEYALITPLDQRDPELMSRLDAVACRVLNPTS
jgi:5'-methylthioadenosine phosphorylase